MKNGINEEGRIGNLDPLTIHVNQNNKSQQLPLNQRFT